MTTTNAQSQPTDRPQFRSRRPHFNHVAMSVPSELLSPEGRRELVDFYDRRFNIQYTEQEKQDLVNFLSVL